MKARFFEFNPDRSQARRPLGKDLQASTAASRTMRHRTTQEQQQRRRQRRRRQQVLPISGSAGRLSETRRSRMHWNQRVWPEHNTRTKRIQRPRQHIKIKIKISYQQPQQQWYTTRESWSAEKKQAYASSNNQPQSTSAMRYSPIKATKPKYQLWKIMIACRARASKHIVAS